MSRKTLMFALTWAAYAGLCLTRKNFGYVILRQPLYHWVEQEWKTEQGFADTAYLVAYMAAQTPAGVMADRYGAKVVLVTGLVGSGLTSVLFSSLPGLVPGPYLSLAMAVVFGVNGLFQSMGWPASVKIIAAWYPQSERSKIMALWSTNYPAGGVLGTCLAGYLVSHYSLAAAFYVPGALVALIGLTNMLFLQNSDEDKEAPAQGEPRKQVDPPMPLTDLLKNPEVWRYGLSYFMIKMMRYSLCLWLPLYLSGVIRVDPNSGFDASVEIYSFAVLVVGSMVGWHASDEADAANRGVLCALSMGTLAFILGALVLFNNSFFDLAFGFAHSLALIFLTVIGFLLYIPDSLIVNTVGQDIGGESSAASACGLINSIGSAGAFFQGFLKHHGWDALFLCFAVASVASAAVLVAPFPKHNAKAKVE